MKMLTVDNGLKQKREEFYSRFPYFFSSFPYEKLEYALYGTLPMEKSIVKEIELATEILWSIFKKTKTEIQKMSEKELENLGFSKNIHKFLKLDYLTHHTALSRFDFVVQGEKIKMLELNNDTPFLIQESFNMANKVCQAMGVESVNKNFGTQTLKESFSKAIKDAVKYLRIQELEDAKIVFIGKDIEEDFEEYSNVRLILDSLDRDIEFIDITQLLIEPDNAMFTPSGEKIDVIIRPAHPIEFLIDDVSDDGEDELIGIELLKLVQQKRVALINSPAAHILQAKITMALVWLWHELDSPLFSLNEHKAIEKYMLPTYTSPFIFEEKQKSYVCKPSLSREGSSVKIHELGEKVIESEYDLYGGALNVYQEYIALPDISVKVNSDDFIEKKWIIGSFVCLDKFAGLTCRVGAKITEWDSHWLAVSLKE